MILRCFPGLAGYQYERYAKVKKVYPGAGQHMPLTPLACCDLELLDSNFKIDRTKKPLKKIPLLRASRHIIDIPEEGDFVLISFPYWQPNTAIIKGILYNSHTVKLEEKTLNLTGSEKLSLDSEIDFSLGSGEDFAVLATPLIEKLTMMCDQIIVLGGADSTGQALKNLGAVQQALTTLKTELNLIKSNIKLGKNVKKSA